MNLANITLVLWLPVVFFIFERLTVQKAIIFSFVSAWLFLPGVLIPLSGIPDWSKMVATVVSVLLCTGMKRINSYLSLRPSWFDIPVLVFCLCPFVSAIMANEGAYDGASAVLLEMFQWGLPYLIGRAFLGNASGTRLLCFGIVLGGVAYIPICLYEIRMGPTLQTIIYNVSPNGTIFGLRYGGYRPVGFLATGLELGWWMCCATLSGYMLWRSGAIKRVQGYPLGPVVLILALVTLACKSTGAILLLTVGFTAIHLAKATKTSLALWPILLIPPSYCVARTTGAWSGETLTVYANEYFGADRGQSLGYRFEQEEGLMRSALQRPIFGSARNGGFNAADKTGRTLITDGLWIIVLGTMGWVGLAALIGMLLLPTIVFIRRIKAEQWFHPQVAPVTTLVVILPLFMIDSLSNAMLNPIYAVAMGAVSGYLASYSDLSLSQNPSTADEVRAQSGGVATLTLEPGISGYESAEAVALQAFDAQRYHLSIRLLDDTLDQLHREFRHRPALGLLVQLGRAHALRARCYARLREEERSIEEREYVFGIWTQYSDLLDGDPCDFPEFAGNLNDLAWSLLVARPFDAASIERAVSYATRVVEAYPTVGVYWNTLGVAHYRAGSDLAAIRALSRSINLSSGNGSPYDFYYLALANHRLGYRVPAEAWLRRADEPQQSDQAIDAVLLALRNEAVAKILA